ncbi:MAG: hypothetical protein ACREC6_07535 [Hyphomicrobiaceae bacterium]
MPTLFRFLLVVGMLSAGTFGGLYVLANYFEPNQKEVVRPLPSVKVKQ